MATVSKNLPFLRRTGVTSLAFQQDFQCQKTTVPNMQRWLYDYRFSSFNTIFLTQYRRCMTERQTDRRTDTRMWCCRPATLAREKSHMPLPWPIQNKDRINKLVLSLLRRLSTWRYPHLLLGAGACNTHPQRARSYRLISPAHRALSSKLAGRLLLLIDGTDRRTDGHRTVT